MTTALSEQSPGQWTGNGVAGRDLPHLGHGVPDQPLIGFGPEIVADVPSALLSQADALEAEPVVQQLVLAADQFLVQRDTGKTVIAGYHCPP